MSASPCAPIPTLVIGGYLGSGKTTLINHILRHAGGQRIAVLVNDFGDQVIDADLIVGAEGEVLSLAGGCVCCSFGADLVGTLATLARREPTPDVILIETSGVALPATVARSAGLAAGVRVEGVIVVCDASATRAQASDRHVGDTVRQQLADADLLLLNKTDLVPDPAAQELQHWLHRAHPHTPVAATVACAVTPALVLGVQALPHARQPGPSLRAATPAAPEIFASRVEHFAGPVDVHAMAAALRAQGSGVVRAKGLLHDIGGKTLLLQAVGRRVEVLAAPQTASVSAIGRLLTITLRLPSGSRSSG